MTMNICKTFFFFSEVTTAHPKSSEEEKICTIINISFYSKYIYIYIYSSMYNSCCVQYPPYSITTACICEHCRRFRSSHLARGVFAGCTPSRRCFCCRRLGAKKPHANNSAEGFLNFAAAVEGCTNGSLCSAVKNAVGMLLLPSYSSFPRARNVMLLCY